MDHEFRWSEELAFREKDERIAELEAELAELRKDKARLDWLGGSDDSPVSESLTSGEWIGSFIEGWVWGRGQTVRDAIDDAMTRDEG